MKNVPGLISRILPFSAVDGPGNRTVIFLQGCNFRCIYCHNPHTIGICTLCGMCVSDCPSKALSFSSDKNTIVCDYGRCVHCDHCIDICPESSNPHALKMSVGEVIVQIRKTAPFISGITVSGGEATQQHDFVHSLFTEIRNDSRLSHLTTFVDSNGTPGPDVWEKILPVTDGVMIDLKAIDAKLHETITGSGNRAVLKSIDFLFRMNKLHEVRIPLVRGYHTEEELADAAAFLLSVSPEIAVKLITVREHGAKKSHLLQKPFSSDEMEHFRNIFLKKGMTLCQITG